MKLINADALINALNHAEWFNIADFNEAVYTVMKAPTVDAVEVVRCKDCKFYHRMTAETGICELGCPHFGYDGFCSEGERKDCEQV